MGVRPITDGNKCSFRVFKIVFWKVGVHVFPDKEVSEASGNDTKGQWDSSRKEDSYGTESERE
jgi:hypothetical protein